MWHPFVLPPVCVAYPNPSLTPPPPQDLIRTSPNSPCVFSDRYLGDAAGVFIFTTLSQAANANEPTPKVVEVKGCYLGLDATLSLAAYLKSPACTLTSLSLEWNSIGSFENGLSELSLALSLNTSLVSLDLRNNNIGPAGGQMLARCLRDNRTLKTLDLRWNEVGNPGGVAFKELLTSGMSLAVTEIKLAGNKMSDVVLSEVETLLTRISGGVGAVTSLSMADDYHVQRGKNEELSREVAKMTSEIQELKSENKTKDTVHEVSRAKSKSEMLSRIDNLEKQLTDSAGTSSLLEIEVLREKERADRLQVRRGRRAKRREQ